MRRTMIYCAQAFWHREGRLVAGEVHQFSSAERAIAGCEILAQGSAGAATYSLTGDPEVDFWEEPQILATFGDVPVPGREDWPEVA